MKILNEFTRLRIYKNRLFNIYVTESATNYYCTAQQIGHALPCSDNWKYPKKEYKTIDKAVEKHLQEVAQRYGFNLKY